MRAGTSPRRHWRLAGKLGAIGGVLLVIALASVGLTLWVAWQLEGGAAAVNEAGRLRMQTWQLAQALTAGDAGRAQRLADGFDGSLALLQRGDPARPLFLPGDAAVQQSLRDVQQDWSVLRDGWVRPAAPAPAAGEIAARAQAFVARVDALVDATERQLSRLVGILNAFQFVMVALVIACGVALMYSAYLFVFNPLAQLQSGLARVGAGDLAARVEVQARDEFGDLAEGFNRMAATLQELYGGLEAKVREKTLVLEVKQERLAALYEAAALAAQAADLDTLARGFARQLRRVGRADASAIRWADEHNRRYLLLASDCLPEALAEQERCLDVGDCRCGQVLAEARTRVIPIRDLGDARTLGHCARAGFENVLSVPVRLHDRMAGEITLFYRTPVALADDERTLLETLASHLAGAIEGLRAAALQREGAVAEERALLARELHDSIAQGLAFLRIQVGLLRGATQRADAAAAARAVAELGAGIDESLADVRELLLHFRTRTNQEDIAPALQTTLTKFEHQTGLDTHLHVHGHGLPLDPDVQVQVLHVVQEALSNVRKHAGASAVWVDVERAPAWRVSVRDDGLGFDPAATADDGEAHVGLRIMRERAQRVGGAVELRSAPGAGTTLTLTLMLPAAVAPAPAGQAMA